MVWKIVWHGTGSCVKERTQHESPFSAGPKYIRCISTVGVLHHNSSFSNKVRVTVSATNKNMCWGEENLITMAQLCVMQANKQPIRYSTLAHNRRILESQTKDVPEKKVRPGYKLSKARQTRIQRAVKTSARLAMVNLPILTNGKTTPLYQALHALSALSSVS